MDSANKEGEENVFFLQNTNPEVFTMKPRPGGYIKLPSDAKEEEAKKIIEKESKEFRVQIALDDDNFSIQSFPEPIPEPSKDAMYMLGVTMSTLVMLAADFDDVGPQYINWAEKYLDCVKDDYGNHPPNVQGVLNFIKNKKAGGGQTVRSTTRVKMGSQSKEPTDEEAEPEEDPAEETLVEDED